MKKLLSAMLCLIMVLGLCACGEQSAKSDRDLYDDFLAGKGTVMAADDLSCIYYDEDGAREVFEAGKAYTKEEFYDRILDSMRANWEDEDIYMDSEYCVIDCGQDGIPEIDVRISAMNEMWGAIEEHYVIKNIDGQLRICYFNESVYRVYAELANSLGLFYEGGSISALENAWSYIALDAQCKPRTIYSAFNEYNLGGFLGEMGGVRQLASEHYDEVQDAVLSSVIVGDFEGNEEDYMSYYNDRIFTYELFTEDEALDALCRQLFEESGTEYVSLEEMSAICTKAMEDAGFTEDMFDDESLEPQWIVLDQEIGRPPITEVTVGSVDELMDALGDNKRILLKPGQYNVTDWMLNSGKVKDCNAGYDEETDYESLEPGVYDNGWGMEPEAMLCGYNRMSIKSQDPENPAEIVCEPRYAMVLHFRNCSEITVSDVIMGHTPEQGTCSGSVLCFTDCVDCTAEKCDLYGCGAYGLSLHDCNIINVNGCVIHDCSYGCAEIFGSYSVSFNDSFFRDCREYSMFDIFNSTVYFEHCDFRDLDGDMFFTNAQSYVSLSNCTFDNAALLSVAADEYYDNGIYIWDYEE